MLEKMRSALLVTMVLVLASSGRSAPRQHTILLGRWRSVEVRSDSGRTQQMRVQELIVDGHLREYTSGPPHDVTERLFVVRRAYRMNDALPDENRKAPQWVWRLGGWVSVGRPTGHIAPLDPPAFDGKLFQATWYRHHTRDCWP